MDRRDQVHYLSSQNGTVLIGFGRVHVVSLRSPVVGSKATIAENKSLIHSGGNVPVLLNWARNLHGY